MQQNQLNINEITVQYKPVFKSLAKGSVNTSLNAYKNAIGFFNEDTLQMQEQFVVLYLNRANAVIGGYRHSNGGMTGTVADIRIILSIALKVLATGIVLFHNHPSGKLTPSQADKDLTHKMKEAAKLMDITIIDHLIISSTDRYYSFSDEGLL